MSAEQARSSSAPVWAGRYEVVSQLGFGAHASVWLARDVRTGARVALKKLESATTSHAHSRFHRELQVLRSLAHPSIVEVLDAGDAPDGLPFLALEYLEGCTLADHLKRHGPMDVHTLGSVAEQIFGALDTAHRAGILHRDIKPSNIFRIADASRAPNRFKLLDFGFALLDDGAKLTDTGGVVGSLRYLAPERLRGAAASVESDLYALGATLREMASGVPAFEAPNGLVLRARILAGNKAAWPARSPRAAQLEEAIDRLIAVDPGERAAGRVQLASAMTAQDLRSARTVSGRPPSRGRTLLGVSPPSPAPLSSAPVRSTPEASGGDAQPRPLEAGDRVAERYTIRRCVGRGGMGVVYEAHDHVLGRSVALKVVRHRAEISDAHHDRLEREARAAARLGHPNLIAISDFGRTEAGAYLSMELLAGESLSQRLARKGRLRESDAIALILQALDGLAAAHLAGMVHRDLKPANLFVVPLATAQPLLKVLDFGIVKLREEDRAARLTATGLQLGTPSYMSPEQLRLDEVDARADVYAMGVTLYEMLAGRNPFAAEGPVQTAHRVIGGDFQDLALAQPDVSSATCAVVRRALRHDPADRYVDAAAMRDALRAGMRDTRQLPSLPPPPSAESAGDPDAATVAARVSAPRKRQRVVPRLAYGLGFAALALAPLIWWQLRVPSGATTSPDLETSAGREATAHPSASEVAPGFAAGVEPSAGEVALREELRLRRAVTPPPTEPVPDATETFPPSEAVSAGTATPSSSHPAPTIEVSARPGRRARVSRPRAPSSDEAQTAAAPRESVLPEEPGILNPFDR